MKKILSLCSLVLLLVACGAKKDGSTTTKSTTEEEKTSQTKPAKSSIEEQASSETSATSQTTEEGGQNQGGRSPELPEGMTYTGSYYAVEGKYGEVLIVNKKYPLSASYAPGEIPEAQAAFLELVAEMQGQGYPVSSQYSGYRSYETQASLYQSYVNQDGQAEADRYSARPGYSEHQTGLAYDLLDSSGQLLTDSASYAWLQANAASYGFVIRYMEGKEAITGYMTETWHLRYIGQEAVDIAASGLTLEEYFGIEGGDYRD